MAPHQAPYPTPHPNRLLASLPDHVFAAISPHLRTVEFKLGDVVSTTGGVVNRVLFPISGAISLVVQLSEGEMIETAMVGRNGAVNAASALDGNTSLNAAVVQVAGASAVIGVDQIRLLADEFKPLRSLLIHHEQILFAQAQQSAACNASHAIEARMCRWLLQMRDLAASDELTLTKSFLAQMLGVLRPSVSLVAQTLQMAGLIEYRRGKIRILDVAGLKESSCECYDVVKGHYERMLGQGAY